MQCMVRSHYIFFFPFSLSFRDVKLNSQVYAYEELSSNVEYKVNYFLQPWIDHRVERLFMLTL